MPNNQQSKSENNVFTNIVRVKRNNRVGFNVPSLVRLTLQGHAVDLAAAAQEKDILLFFFTTLTNDNVPADLAGDLFQSCGFKEAFDLLHEKNILVYGVTDQTTLTTQQYTKLPFEVIDDSDHRLLELLGVDFWKTVDGSYQVFTAKETLFIRKGGKITLHFKTIYVNEFDKHIAELLGKLELLGI